MSKISNKSSNTIISGTSEEDSILNYGNNVTINAGAGNDSVRSYGVNVTINSGAGDDTIDSYGSGTVYRYNAGDGNDIINGFSKDDTILIPNGTWTSATLGSDIILSVGKGLLMLKGAATLSAVNVVSSEADIHPVNIIENYSTNNTLLTGTSYIDSIYNLKSSNVTINTGDGDDSIDSSFGNNVLINAGSGDDTIYNGNQWNNNGGEYVTINGGKGNDYILLGDNAVKNIIKYADGDGNDTVYNYNPSNTVSLTGGTVTSTSVSGDDLILKTSNGSIRFVKTAAVKVNGKIYGNQSTKGTDGDDKIANVNSKVTINSGAGNDFISNFSDNVSINTGVGLNTVKNYGSNVTIKTGSGENHIYNFDNATITGTSDNDSINIYGEKATFIAGEGNDSISNDSASVSIDAGAGDDTVYNNGYGYNSYIKLGAGNDSLYNYYGYHLTLDGGEGNDSIQSTGDYISIDAGEGDDTISNAYGDEVSINGGEGNDSIINSESYYVSINGGAGNDLVSVASSAQVTINAGKANDTIKLNGSGEIFIEYNAGDGNDIIYGFDKTSTLKIAGDSYSTQPSGLDVIVEIGNGKVTLKNAATLSKINIASQIIKLTEDKDVYDNDTDDATILALDGDDFIYNNSAENVSINTAEGDDSVYNSYGGSNVTIDTGTGNDTIQNSGSNVTINAGTGNDSIYNSRENVMINAGAGNDSVLSYGINITINGGTGDDIIEGYGAGMVYRYNAGDGNDVIYGFNEDDTILIPNDTWTSATLGSDIVLTVGEGILVLKEAATLSAVNVVSSEADIHPINIIRNYYTNNTLLTGISYRDSIYNTGSKVAINAGSGNDTVQNSGSQVTINAGNGDDSINSSYGNNVSINGGSGNDTIYNGDQWNNNGGANVTLDGGAGNDKIILSGNAVKNIIKYAVGDGNDTVYNYNPTNTVSLTGGTVTSTSVSGDDLILKTSKGSIRFVETVAVKVNGKIYGNHSTVGTNDDDKITNFNSKVTINGSSGNDLISNGGDNVSINTGVGLDTVKNYGSNVTIKTGLRENYIYNYDSATITGTSDNDSINIYGEKATLIAGEGNDSIYNDSASVSVDAGAGDDTVRNGYYGNDSYIKLGAGNDSLYNYYGYYSTIDGGEGNDTLSGYFVINSIAGGAGNDHISLMGTNFYVNTIIGGKGNDTIYSNVNGGTLYKYAKGDGNDIIYNVSPNDTLSISGADYSLKTVGDDLLVNVKDSGTISLIAAAESNISIVAAEGKEENVTVGTGKDIDSSDDKILLTGSKYVDTIKNYGDKVTINAGSDNDTIYNDRGNNASINAGKGNDSIYGNNDYATVLGGAGNDTVTGNYYKSKISGDNDNDVISISSYWYNTISGGNGKDTIYADGSEHSVSGGAGNDRISLSGDHLTITGGKGNDIIFGSTATSHLYQYNAGDGNDVIYNYGSNDSITISGVNSDGLSTSVKGDNVIIKVKDSGNITLVGGKNKTLNIYSNDSAPEPQDKEINAQDVIKKFMKTLSTTKNSGVAAVSEAVSVATGGYFANINFAVNQMISDRENSRGENTEGKITSFLKDYCDIVLNNDDTGAITGKDAGGASVKTAESIVEEKGNLDTKFNGTSFKTKNGLTFRLYDSKLSNDEKYMWRALKTWWADKSLDLIKESYDYSFNDSDASVKDITVKFVNDPIGNYLAYTVDSKEVNGIQSRTLVINKVFYHNFSNSDKNGISPDGNTYLDRTIAHELTHAVMMAKIHDFQDLPQFIIEGTAELTHGVDDTRSFAIMDALSNTDEFKKSLSFLPFEVSSASYAAGYTFLRWLAKQGTEHYPTEGDLSSGFNNLSIAYNDAIGSGAISVKNKVLTVSKDFKGTEVDLTKYSSAVKTVNASKLVSGVMITGNTNASSLVAGTGNDTIFANKRQ